MRGRILVPVACLVLGGGLGLGAGRYLPTRGASPPPEATPGPPSTPAAGPDPGDEVVVEVRVRAPGSKAAPRAFAKGGSTRAPGVMVNTQNPLDLAIEGDGFFQVHMPDGAVAYTRGGSFGVNTVGKLVTAHGHLLSTDFTLPDDTMAVMVGTDGQVSVQRRVSVNASTVLGQLTLARFANPGWLLTDDKGYAHETSQSGNPTLGTPGSGPFGLVRQGFRERHSEQLTEALVDLVRDLTSEVRTAGGGSVRVVNGR